MSRLWLLQQSLEGLETYMRLANRSATGSLVLNLADVLERAAGGGPQTVAPQLSISDEAFDLDLFDEGVTFASDRLVRALALSGQVAELGPVNDGACSPGIRRKGYRTLRLLTNADALDPAATDGEVVDWIDVDGSARSEWLPAAPQPNRPAPKRRWRIGLEPPADLFLVNGTPWRAATDALAARVTAAGAVGVDFVDPIASAATGDLVTRNP